VAADELPGPARLYFISAFSLLRGSTTQVTFVSNKSSFIYLNGQMYLEIQAN
jgi:hypothetical protein